MTHRIVALAPNQIKASGNRWLGMCFRRTQMGGYDSTWACRLMVQRQYWFYLRVQYIEEIEWSIAYMHFMDGYSQPWKTPGCRDGAIASEVFAMGMTHTKGLQRCALVRTSGCRMRATTEITVHQTRIN
jgi:hypothetical protein